jgi:hypothetical protein
MSQKLNRDIAWIAVLLVLSLVIGACARPAEKATPSQSTSSDSPIAAQEQSSPLSPPASPSTELDMNVKPSPGKAVLKGRIDRSQPSNVLLGEMFLGKAVPTSNPEVDLIELDEKTAPKALVRRDTGDFIFIDVEPGKYGLIVWQPTDSHLVDDPKTQQTLFVTLEPNQTQDVGTLRLP